jgi:aminopeptidase N
MRAALLAPVALGVVLELVGCQSAAGRPTAHSPVVSSYDAAVSHPRTDPYYPHVGTTTVDVLHYGLDLTWSAPTRRLSGTAAVRFRATQDESKVSLDLAAPLHVSSLDLDGNAVDATHPGHELVITTGALKRNSRHTLTITYSGKPHPVPAPTTRSDIPDLGWTVTSGGQAWSLQEPYGAYTWYPVNDHPSDKAFYDITWHTQPSWHGVSNGDLVSDDLVGGQRVTHWRLTSPAASYLVTVGIGPYQPYHQTGPHGLPITYWVRDADKGVLPLLRQTPAMLRWLEARLGPFPFDRIGDVVVPTNSGEETQTLVTIGPSVLDSSVGRSDLLHEYSHQWYGDEVTPNNWKDLWLNESFAMYIQIRWEATHHVQSMHSWRQELNFYDARLRRKYGPPGEYDPTKFAELNVYFCGARMLDRLHSKLGDTMFGKVLRDWPHREQYDSVDRAGWIRYLDHVTGRNLGPFVRHWLTDKKSPA